MNPLFIDNLKARIKFKERSITICDKILLRNIEKCERYYIYSNKSDYLLTAKVLVSSIKRILLYSPQYLSKNLIMYSNKKF
ncbi:hypothetical protein RIR_jg12186.t1 [Rhizophagus irregularis DAOM 181602=DAOM 197198]|nr:hypothetical protein RIR_jg12186.t1 [Rhizophagus irregularis DAOM 181602=DAOM 197198]